MKWPGGKFRLLDAILPELPSEGRLVEPFVGSGAVFMNAANPDCLLCDINPDLIGFFQALAADGDAFIRECREFFVPEANRSDEYYRRRDELNALPPGQARAALFLYCNRHGYNGLSRYNARGEFNVPFGRYSRPYFPEAEMRAFLEKKASTRLEFRVADFRQTFSLVREGDVVYCDPPYIPLSPTANFTGYAGNSFGRVEQEGLAQCIERAAERARRIVVSNHDTPEARELYRRASGMRRISVRRSISCKGARRGTVAELLAVYKRLDGLDA